MNRQAVRILREHKPRDTERFEEGCLEEPEVEAHDKQTIWTAIGAVDTGELTTRSEPLRRALRLHLEGA